jgi:hypothetical protein
MGVFLTSYADRRELIEKLIYEVYDSFVYQFSGVFDSAGIS